MPVPIGRPVTDLEDAAKVVEEIGGWPWSSRVTATRARAWTVNIVSQDHLAIAYKVAAEHGEVMVERYLPGQ